MTRCMMRLASGRSLNPHLHDPHRDAGGASHGGREYTVGQYVVDLPAFESLALPLFRGVSQTKGFFSLFCLPT